jgi:hypothetical protein
MNLRPSIAFVPKRTASAILPTGRIERGCPLRSRSPLYRLGISISSPQYAQTPLHGGVCASLTQTEGFLRFATPPFVILDVPEQVAHDAVLPMPKTERFDTRGFQVPAHGASITRPAIRQNLERDVFPVRGFAFQWGQARGFGP